MESNHYPLSHHPGIRNLANLPGEQLAAGVVICLPEIQNSGEIGGNHCFRLLFLAVSQRESRQWLIAIQSKPIRTLLDNRTFRVALRPRTILLYVSPIAVHVAATSISMSLMVSPVKRELVVSFVMAPKIILLDQPLTLSTYQVYLNLWD